jgi:hypothetical protein
MRSRPDRDEAAEYYFTYIDQVGGGDIRDIIAAQGAEIPALLRGLDESQARHRYAPGKWTIAEVVSHLSDTERLFLLRAWWFARGFDTPLPSFDQNVALASAGTGERSWSSLVDEFAAARAASVAFFRHLPADAWMRRGTASGFEFTVRALAYIAAGHVTHHVRILNERYLTR